MKRDDNSSLPLFSWQAPCSVIAFPLDRRMGKIRDVAAKLLDKTTDRHAEWYRRQVTEALLVHLERLGLPEGEQDDQLGAFWSRVQDEMIRQTYRGTGSHNPKGAA